MNTIKNQLAEEEAERRLQVGSASVASDSPNITTRQATLNVEANYMAALARGEIVETSEEKFQRENFPLSFWHKETYTSD